MVLCLDSKSEESKMSCKSAMGSCELCLDSKSEESKMALSNQLFTSWLPELNLLGQHLCGNFFGGLAMYNEGSLPLRPSHVDRSDCPFTR